MFFNYSKIFFVYRNFNNFIFKDIDYVYGITFTGGEPLTQVNTIIEVLDYIKEHNIGLGYFYIVSNGTIYSRKLMNVLDYFYNYYVDEKEISAFEISQDQYHVELDALRKQNIWKYQELVDAFGYDFIHLENRKKILSVIKEGNARFFLDGRESFYNNGIFTYDSFFYFCHDIINLFSIILISHILYS